MSNLLIELGIEELPVGTLDVLYAALPKKAEDVFRTNRLSFNKIRMEATPRRIALFVEALADRQQDQQLEFTGPAQEKAYQDGKPTPALQGFLKSKNAKESDIKIKETPRGKFVTIEKKEIGKSVQQVLPGILKEIFLALSFPKNMRWEKTNFRFPRPIRWVIALLDKKIIPFEIGAQKAGNKTFGHRFLAPKPILIPTADWNAYQKLLRRSHVILKLEEREALIRKALQEKFHQKSLDEDLVHTTAHLVEEPFLIQGTFSKSYLDLPAEVLASCMKKNQKIFAIYDAKGHLVGKFAGVLNGKRRGLPKIQADFENVLESRLRDARYFYAADTKEKLESKLGLLEQVTYLGKLGTMKEKTERLERLAETFAQFIGRKDIQQDLIRVARLSKIDLMTQLVYEFPDLQGIMGREYALESGEKKEVADAIGTQYLPKNLTEESREIPKQISPLGAMFGIIDRLDLLVGAFGSGIEPTGSQDPFALRRAGGALVKLIRAFGFPFGLNEAITCAIQQYRKGQLSKTEDLNKRLTRFFEDRVIFEVQAKPGTRAYEILQAVFRSTFDDLADVYRRYEILSKLYEQEPEALIKAAKVVERTANILKGVQNTSEVNPELFKESAEKKVFQLFEQCSGEIQNFVKKRDYERATVRFGEVFYQPLHDYFKQVMINVEDPAIRQSRQALMKKINFLYSQSVADLSMLSRLDQG